MWIFGYGSLIWKPNFAYEERVTGEVVGWKRRFWQGSEDHRGVPGKPGRVVTLLPAAGLRTWGVAYRVSGAVEDSILRALDHREKGGYERHWLPVYTPDRETALKALVYVATPENRNYLGEAEIYSIAAQVVSSTGPSGPNDEYVLRLDDTLRKHGVVDEHVRELAEAVRRLKAREELLR